MSQKVEARLNWNTQGARFLLVMHLCFVRIGKCDLRALSINGKPASQSMGYYPAGNAVDNNLNTFSHGADSGDPHPWWRVDLLSNHCLGEITVTTRQGCCGQYRFAAAVARAGMSSDYAGNPACGSPAARAQSTNGATHVFLCDTPLPARYVTVDIDPSHALLMLAEVRVKEYTGAECGQLDEQDLTTEAPNPNPNLKAKSRSSGFQLFHKGGLVKHSDPLSSKEAKSLLMCAGFCRKDSRCLTFDFTTGDGHCRLHNLTSTDIEITRSEGSSVYVTEN